MSSFLKEVVDKIVKNHTSFEDVIVIVPSQRAGLYLKHLLAKKLNKTVFSPSIQTVQTFIEKSSSFSLVDPLELLFLAYQAYQKISESEETFAEFIGWIPTLINDFNEVDHYLLDAKQVFGNLSQIKEIEEWSFNSEELSEGQEKFQQFWKLFYPLYQDINKTLIKQKKGYQGQITRFVAENLSVLDQWKNKTIYIAGVNALTSSEEKIISTLKKNYQASIFWDNDAYYVSNKAHEAGLFQRRYQKDWAPEIENQLGNHFVSSKKINAYQLSGEASQVKLAGEIIEKWATDGSLNNVALVLADEQLLIPMISSLPENVREANITMGYPANQNPLFHFFKLLLQIQEQYLAGSKSNEIHHLLVKELIAHPSLSFAINAKKVEEFTLYINKKNISYLSHKELLDFFESNKEITEIVQLAINPWSNIPMSCFESWGKITNKIHSNTNNKIDKEVLFKFSEIIKHLHVLSNKHKYLTDIHVLKSFVQKLWSKELIPFFGEPLQGLQIMGMLETRALDFDRVILLGVNEGILPKGSNQSSFIPQELKRYYKLPTNFEKDAIYAYHFYRLLQRSKEAHLTYNTAQDGLAKGEKSRFITQLELEFPGKINQYTVNVPYEKEHPNKGIPLTKELKSVCITYLTEKGLSPSALNTFLACPQNFVYKYFLNIKEPQEVEEQLKDNSIGTVVHAVLEKMLLPKVGMVLTSSYCKELLTQTQEKVEKEFHLHFPYAKLETGANHIAFQVALKQVNAFLQRQIKEIENLSHPITIIGLEKEFSFYVDVLGHKIKCKGIIDRIDKVGNQIRVLDYKTGKVDSKFLKITKPKGATDPSEYNIALKKDKDKINQLQMYMYGVMEDPELYVHKDLQITSGIVAMNNISEPLVSYLFDSSGEIMVWSKEVHAIMETCLEEVCTLIMEPENEMYLHTEKEPNYCIVC